MTAANLSNNAAAQPLNAELAEDDVKSLRERLDIPKAIGWCKGLELDHTIDYLEQVDAHLLKDKTTPSAVITILLNAIQDRIDEKYPAKGITPLKKARRRVFSQVVSHFNTFKKAWRDYTMHTPVKYTNEQAVEITEAVRAFMRSLERDGLKEKPKKKRSSRVKKLR